MDVLQVPHRVVVPCFVLLSLVKTSLRKKARSTCHRECIHVRFGYLPTDLSICIDFPDGKNGDGSLK